jgi:ABC-type branched-subunit amino acid transport system ATPase component
MSASPQPADDTVLRLRGVNKRFGGVVAANDVNLDLPRGFVTALVGPNGAGKTTLFNLITGNLRPDSGAIDLGNRSLLGIDPLQAAGFGIARSFQDLRLFEQMTAFENVLTVMERSAWPWQAGGLNGNRARRARVAEVLERVGLHSKHDMRAIDLGYAEQKFLSLARILVTDARLWLLDEPASGLDPASYERFVRLVRDPLKDGITICLIEHNLDIVQGIADRIAFLDQGAVLAAGEPRAILDDPKLAAIYFGERR